VKRKQLVLKYALGKPQTKQKTMRHLKVLAGVKVWL
jgi:hypothetical protein